MGLWGDKEDPWPTSRLERLLWFFDSCEVCFHGFAGLLLLLCLISGWILVLLFAVGVC